ncbi:hypothetical protein CLF_110989 [Clonorchis sinensis]|uniref:Uncharacterized protein n=1 Tax=Clonorchis sinensis TaxID=79923 RepID=G7YU59_CLOSI|nr:hypothetical protein CLF_110989 [Clonorchis sinensis]
MSPLGKSMSSKNVSERWSTFNLVERCESDYENLGTVVPTLMLWPLKKTIMMIHEGPVFADRLFESFLSYCSSHQLLKSIHSLKVKIDAAVSKTAAYCLKPVAQWNIVSVLFFVENVKEVRHFNVISMTLAVRGDISFFNGYSEILRLMRKEEDTQFDNTIIIIDSMKSVFNTDASLQFDNGYVGFEPRLAELVALDFICLASRADEILFSNLFRFLTNHRHERIGICQLDSFRVLRDTPFECCIQNTEDKCQIHRRFDHEMTGFSTGSTKRYVIETVDDS